MMVDATDGELIISEGAHNGEQQSHAAGAFTGNLGGRPIDNPKKRAEQRNRPHDVGQPFCASNRHDEAEAGNQSRERQVDQSRPVR